MSMKEKLPEYSNQICSSIHEEPVLSFLQSYLATFE